MSYPPGMEWSDSAAISLSNRKRYLLLGIAGAGMTALAQILEDLGHCVTGTDSGYEPQDVVIASHAVPGRKIVAWSPDALQPESIDVCVFTPAVNSECSLLRKMRAADVPTATLHECIAELFRAKRQLCVAGTHGKTTTSAMVSWILQQAGQQPSYFVGGDLINTHRSGVAGNGNWAVLESCEFSSSFLNFQPQTLLLTGVERDHFDCFPQRSEEDEAFEKFISQLTINDTLIRNGNCQRSAQLAGAARGRIVTVGVGGRAGAPDFDWTARDLCISSARTSFVCSYDGQETSVQLNVPGRHNVANAVAAMAAVAEAGVDPQECAEALRTFEGVRRRFEVRGQVNGVTLVDDYAHHPTAVKETIRTAQAVFPGQRIVVVFEPHQAVRTRALFSDFVDALQLADEALLLPVFPARENIGHLECCRLSGQVVRELNRRESKAFLFANLDQVASRIDHSGRLSDVFIAMGAGRTNLIYDELTRRLQRHSVA